MKKIIYIMCAVTAVMAITSCGKRAQRGQDKIVAKVGKIAVNTEDLKSEAVYSIAARYAKKDAEQIKRDVLDEIITKDVLIQEAQAEKLDRDQAFMTEIERYWQRSLIKLLLKKKSDEISRTVDAEDKEIADEYNRMKRRIFASVVLMKNKSDAEALSNSGEGFLEKKNALLAGQKIAEDQTNWYTAGDLPRQIEDALFNLQTGQTSRPEKFGDYYVVAHVLQEEAVNLAALEDMSDEIRERIKRYKKERELERWINELKAKTPIKIYEDVLKKVEIE